MCCMCLVCDVMCDDKQQPWPMQAAQSRSAIPIRQHVKQWYAERGTRQPQRAPDTSSARHTRQTILDRPRGVERDTSIVKMYVTGRVCSEGASRVFGRRRSEGRRGGKLSVLQTYVLHKRRGPPDQRRELDVLRRGGSQCEETSGGPADGGLEDVHVALAAAAELLGAAAHLEPPRLEVGLRRGVAGTHGGTHGGQGCFSRA